MKTSKLSNVVNLAKKPPEKQPNLKTMNFGIKIWVIGVKKDKHYKTILEVECDSLGKSPISYIWYVKNKT